MWISRRDRLLLFLLLLKPVVRRGLSFAEAVRSMQGEGWVDDATIERMARQLEDGQPLSAMMHEHPQAFPPPLPALIRAGEHAGDLAQALARATTLARHDLRCRERLRAALVYPAVCMLLVLVMAVLLVVLDLTGLSHELSAEFSRSPVEPWIHPTLARILLLGGVIACVLLLWRLFGSRRDLTWDRLRLNLPVLGRMYRLSAAAGFTRALGSLLASGSPIDAALPDAAPAAGNRWVEAELGLRLVSVRDGEALARALTLPGVFPPSLTWRLALGVERQQLPRALAEAATAYEAELAAYAGRLARTIEPAAIFAVGIAACLVIWAWSRPLQELLHRLGTAP